MVNNFKLSKIKSDRLLAFALFIERGGAFDYDKLVKKYIRFFNEIEEKSAIKTLRRDIKTLQKFKVYVKARG